VTARWEAVLDTQQQLWGWWQTPLGHQYAKTFANDQLLKKGQDAMTGVQEVQETMLFHADPIAIEPDMWTLVEYAQKEFQPEPLRETDIITEAGFMVLPRPLVSKDIWGKTVSYRAIGWMPAWRITPPAPELLKKSPALAIAQQMMGWDRKVYGIYVSLYSHIADPDDYDAPAKERFRRAHDAGGFPDLTLAHLEVFRFGQDYAHATREMFDGLHADHLLAADGVVLDNGDDPGKPAGYDYYTEHGVDWDKAIASYIDTRRSIQALFRLLSQHIAVRTKHRASRPAQRRAKRQAYPPKDVTVVTLRRPRNEDMPLDPAGKHVEWSHRWIVSGHWRNQYYASAGEHRQIWISPFVKGPPDKELVIPEKRVFVLSR